MRYIVRYFESPVYEEIIIIIIIVCLGTKFWLRVLPSMSAICIICCSIKSLFAYDINVCYFTDSTYLLMNKNVLLTYFMKNYLSRVLFPNWILQKAGGSVVDF